MSNLGLETDYNNPNFVGARNPDDLLHVEFFSKVHPNSFESERQGRPIFYETDMVRISTPGNQLNVIETFVRDEHKVRFPRQWMIYQNRKANGDIGDQTVGTPLSEWPAISRSDAEEYRALKFYTVEQIAGASDQQIQRIGMNAYSMREKARAFLAKANDNALEQRQASEIAKKDQEIADLKNQMLLLSSKFEQFVKGEEIPKPKRKYTRRVKNDDDASASSAGQS